LSESSTLQFSQVVDPWHSGRPTRFHLPQCRPCTASFLATRHRAYCENHQAVRHSIIRFNRQNISLYMAEKACGTKLVGLQSILITSGLMPLQKNSACFAANIERIRFEVHECKHTIQSLGNTSLHNARHNTHQHGVVVDSIEIPVDFASQCLGTERMLSSSFLRMLRSDAVDEHSCPPQRQCRQKDDAFCNLLLKNGRPQACCVALAVSFFCVITTDSIIA